MIFPQQQQQPPNPDDVLRQQLLARLTGSAPKAPADTAAQPADTGGAMTPPSNQPQPVKPLTQPAAAPDKGVDPLTGELSAKPATGFDLYKQDHPMNTPDVPPYNPETQRHALLRGLFSGMQEFGRPGEGAQSNEDWNKRQLDLQEKNATWPMRREALQAQGYEAEQKQGLTAAQTTEAQLKSQPDTKQMLDAELAKPGGGDQDRVAYLMDSIQQQYGAKSTRYTAKEITDPGSPNGHRTVDFDSKKGRFYDPATREEITGAQEYVKPPQLTPEIAGQAGVPPTSSTWGPPSGKTVDGKDPQAPKDYGTLEAAIAAHAKYAQGIKEQPMLDAAKARGMAYQNGRFYQVLDSENGMAPVMRSGEQLSADQESVVKGGAPRYYSGPEGTKAMTKEMVVGDIRGSGQRVNADLDAMAKGGNDGFDAGTRLSLATALADPNSTAGKFAQSIPRGVSLTREQQHYVIDLFQLREQAMNLRAVVGGSSAEDVRNAILQTIPGAGTPSETWAKDQFEALNAVLDRVGQGIPETPLNTKGSHGQPPSTQATKPAKLVNGVWTDATTGKPILTK